MSRLTLDFASAQRSVTTRKPYLDFGVLAAGALALVITAWYYNQQVEANAALRLERDQMTARTQRSHAKQQLPAELSAQFEQAATAYAEIMTPWTDLFRVLETKKSNNIALLSITANTAKKEFALSGDAKDFGALSGFSEALSSSPLFQRVTLSKHTLSESAPPIVVKFDLALEWRTDTDPGR